MVWGKAHALGGGMMTSFAVRVWGRSEQTWDYQWKNARQQAEPCKTPLEVYFSSNKIKQTRGGWRGHKVEQRNRKEPGRHGFAGCHE